MTIKELAVKVAVFVCFFGLAALSILAQGSNDLSNPKRGSANGASFSLSDIENINLTNGNLALNMPLVKTPAGRGGLSASHGLVYNSKLYDTIILEQMNSSSQITHQYFPKVSEEGDGRELIH